MPAPRAISGVAVSAAPLPRQVKAPPNEPSQRFSILAVVPSAKETGAQVSQSAEKLSEAGYPVTTLMGTVANGKLTDDERDELAHWIDSLDRF